MGRDLNWGNKDNPTPAARLPDQPSERAQMRNSEAAGHQYTLHERAVVNLAEVADEQRFEPRASDVCDANAITVKRPIPSIDWLELKRADIGC